MALQQQVFYVGAFNDSLANGNNYVSGQIYQVFNTNDTLVPIFNDASGTSPINQDGISNISNTDGRVEFYIDSGDYYLKVGVEIINFDTSNIDDLATTYTLPSMLALKNSNINFSDGKPIRIISFWGGLAKGGGNFYWDASKSKTEHDGGTIVAPEALDSWDGTQENLTQLVDWSGSGSGCFVRSIDFNLCPSEIFGSVGNGVADDNTSWQATINSRFESFAGGDYTYYFGSRGVTVGNKVKFYLKNNGISTRFKMENSLSGTAFTNSLFFSGGATPVTEYFHVDGGYYYVEGPNDLNTGVQGLETKNCSVTIVKNVVCENLSQFAVAASHDDDSIYDLVHMEDIQILNHGSSTKTGPQVGLELHEKDTIPENSCNVKRKVIRNILVEMRNGVQGAIMKLGTAYEVHLDNVTLRAFDRKGTSGALEVGGYYTNLIKYDLFVNGLVIEDLGANERAPLYFGGPVNSFYKNVNIKSGSQAFIQWDAQGATIQRYVRFDNAALNGCEIRTSSAASLDNNGVILSLEIFNSDNIIINPRQQDGRPINKLYATDTHFASIFTDVGINNIELNSCDVDYMRVFNNSAAFSANSYVFNDTKMRQYNHGPSGVGSTLSSVEFNGGIIGDGISGRLRFIDNNGDGVIPDKISLKGATMLLGDGSAEFVSNNSTDLHNITLNQVSASFTGTQLTFRGSSANIYNCSANNLTPSTIFNMIDDFDLNIHGGTYNTSSGLPLDPLRCNFANRVHERGVIIQTQFLATRDT